MHKEGTRYPKIKELYNTFIIKSVDNNIFNLICKQNISKYNISNMSNQTNIKSLDKENINTYNFKKYNRLYESCKTIRNCKKISYNIFNKSRSNYSLENFNSLNLNNMSEELAYNCNYNNNLLESFNNNYLSNPENEDTHRVNNFRNNNNNTIENNLNNNSYKNINNKDIINEESVVLENLNNNLSYNIKESLNKTIDFNNISNNLVNSINNNRSINNNGIFNININLSINIPEENSLNNQEYLKKTNIALYNNQLEFNDFHNEKTNNFQSVIKNNYDNTVNIDAIKNENIQCIINKQDENKCTNSELKLTTTKKKTEVFENSQYDRLNNNLDNIYSNKYLNNNDLFKIEENNSSLNILSCNSNNQSNINKNIYLNDNIIRCSNDKKGSFVFNIFDTPKTVLTGQLKKLFNYKGNKKQKLLNSYELIHNNPFRILKGSFNKISSFFTYKVNINNITTLNKLMCNLLLDLKNNNNINEYKDIKINNNITNTSCNETSNCSSFVKLSNKIYTMDNNHKSISHKKIRHNKYYNTSKNNKIIFEIQDMQNIKYFNSSNRIKAKEILRYSNKTNYKNFVIKKKSFISNLNLTNSRISKVIDDYSLNLDNKLNSNCLFIRKDMGKTDLYLSSNIINIDNIDTNYKFNLLNNFILINEKTMIEVHSDLNKRNDVQNISKYNLIEIYPDKLRLDCSNLNPVANWICGAQVVKMNNNNKDDNYIINKLFFLQNNNTGLVKKPDNIYSINNIKIKFRIELILGLNLHLFLDTKNQIKQNKSRTNFKVKRVNNNYNSEDVYSKSNNEFNNSIRSKYRLY